MVYVPWKVVEKVMLRKWEAKDENPDLPRPTKTDINIQWFRWLEYYPMSAMEYEKFIQQFTWDERRKIEFRLVFPFKASPTRSRAEPTPPEQPIGQEEH